jgi:hypothetical protein
MTGTGTEKTIAMKPRIERGKQQQWQKQGCGYHQVREGHRSRDRGSDHSRLSKAKAGGCYPLKCRSLLSRGGEVRTIGTDASDLGRDEGVGSSDIEGFGSPI